jgi:hypothetical protein
MTRMESPSRIFAIAAAVALACAGLVAATLIGAAGADGKKKKGKGGSTKVITAKQHSIVDSGKVTVRTGRGKLVVRANSLGKSLGVVTKSAKARDAGRTKLRLNARGKELLAGCSVDQLELVVKSKTKGGKKKTKTVPRALNRDLAICSIGSENPIARPYWGPPLDVTAADRCDFMDPAVCLQPWPNDYFTVADGSTDTGRRLNFNAQSMPKNINGVGVDPTDYRRADGYSPGNMIVVKVPGVSTQAAFQNSGLVPITDIRRFADPNQAAVVIDAATGQRHPIFTELDANPASTGDVNLIIRPTVNFEEGHRYIVALRGLRDAQNQPLDPPMPFRVYRDRLITKQDPVEARRPHMETLIQRLQNSAVPRANLYMAWDFTVASEDSLAGRALALRDDALERIGDDTPGDPITGNGDTTPGDGVIDGDAPEFEIQSTTDPAGNVLRQIEGTLTNVPCYLTPDCKTGSQFAFPPNSDDPTIAPTSFADDPAGATTGISFRCIIPDSVDGGTNVVPLKPGTYGHGLLGSYTQVGGQANLANQNDSIWCATDWSGFANQDLATVFASLADMSNFNKLSDRMQQGFVNFLYLGRAMAHPDGFNTDPAFQVDAGSGLEPVIDTASGDLYFEGISQGAIMGGALTALSPDFTRSVLNVPGMNYSTLLRRSVDSDEYFKAPNAGLYANYPNELERPLLLSMVQLLWDRGEANGYAHHMTTDPLPNTPEHQVLLQNAFGDHQVANIAAEVEARTIGASVYAPALDPGRHWEANPFMDIPAIDFGPAPFDDPFTGSAMVYYDGGPIGFVGVNGDGTATPPNENVAPYPSEGYGDDPHGYPRRSPDGLQHVSDFLQPNGFILPCTDPGPVLRPCYANGWTGP